MIEVLANPSTYKDLLDSLGKLSEWAEQASSNIAAKEPPKDLVDQFQITLNNLEPTPQTHEVKLNPSESYPPPEEILKTSSFFEQKAADPTFGGQYTVTDVQENQTLYRRTIPDITVNQEINLQKGLQNLDAVKSASTESQDWRQVINELSNILTKESTQISPHDLLEAQRLVGLLKMHAESGQKTSEGVSDTFEQLLQQQG